MQDRQEQVFYVASGRVQGRVYGPYRERAARAVVSALIGARLLTAREYAALRRRSPQNEMQTQDEQGEQ